jgi:hypothetical protein
MALTAKQRLAIGSGIAIAVAAGIWTLVGIRNRPEDLICVPSASEITHSPQTTSAPTQPEEKTLPVSVTHNARGTSLPTLKSGQNSTEPKLLLSKDRTYD